MKTSSIAVETSRSTTQSDSIVRQTNKRSSYLSYTTMNNKHIFNDILMHIHSYIIISHFIPLSFFLSFFLFLFLSFFALRKWGWEGRWTELAARVEKRAGSVREAGEEIAGSRIPKVAESRRNREKLHNIVQY